MQLAPVTDLTKAILVYAPPQHEQYYRPYVGNMTGGTFKKLSVLTDGGVSLKPNNFLDVAHDIISPSSVPAGQVQIPYGFGEPRLAFFLEFTTHGISGSYRELVTGFTSHVGVNPATGSLDPQMVFYINSVMEVRSDNYETYTPEGSYYKTLVTNNANLLPKVDHAGIVSLRPEDVIGINQNNFLMNEYASQVIDGRSNLNARPMFSNRTNVMPNHYLSRIISGVITAERELATGDGNGDMWDNAIGSVATKPLELSSFLAALGNRDPHAYDKMTMGEIQAIWPRTVDFWQKTLPKPNSQPIDHRLASEHWRGALVETQIAFNLTHILPALMSKMMLLYVEIDMNNRNFEGVHNSVILDHHPMFKGTITPMHLKHLQNQIELDIVRALLVNRVTDYHINMKVNLLNLSTFTISVNGQPPVPFTAPMYCESYYTPVIGAQENLAALSNTTEEIVTRLSSNQRKADPFREFNAGSFEQAAQNMFGGIARHSVASPPPVNIPNITAANAQPRPAGQIHIPQIIKS